jgi:hypothetical protein
MDLKDITLTTTWPQVPGIVNYNNAEIKKAFDLIYDSEQGIIIVPVTTTGRVKASSGEFVNVIVDNLTVKNQYTNLYDNNTTADYNWYKMIIDPIAVLRDPCTASNYWPFENYLGYKIIDVNKPYYKITNSTPIVLNNQNISQVVGIFFDASLVGTNPFQILLDPCTQTTYTVDVSFAGSAYVELIATYVDPSWGSTWEQYKYAIEGGGGSTQIFNLVGFLKEASIGTDFYWENGLLEVSTSIIGVSQSYVDGSLVTFQGSFVASSSLGTGLYWNLGLIEVSTTIAAVTQTYVDGSLLARDVSITALDIRLEAVETSLNYVSDLSTILTSFVSNASLSNDFFWGPSGYLEVSTGIGEVTLPYVDGSLATKVNKAGDTITGQLSVNSDVILGSGNSFYLGDPSSDGCWRFIVDTSGNLAVQKRVTGTWLERGVFI